MVINERLHCDGQPCHPRTLSWIDRFPSCAEEAGVACGPLEDDEKQDLIHRLDATVAHLYGLTKPQLVHIFETFHEGWDYQDRLDATLKHFSREAS